MTDDQNDSPNQINWERVAKAETHLLRISILELLAIDGGRIMSPKEMANELQESLGTIIYHADHLRKSELIQLVHKHQVGGAIDHLYSLPGLSAGDLADLLKHWQESRWP
jgi:hypothetical protein